MGTQYWVLQRFRGAGHSPRLEHIWRWQASHAECHPRHQALQNRCRELNPGFSGWLPRREAFSLARIRYPSYCFHGGTPLVLSPRGMLNHPRQVVSYPPHSTKINHRAVPRNNNASSTVWQRGRCMRNEGQTRFFFSLQIFKPSQTWSWLGFILIPRFLGCVGFCENTVPQGCACRAGTVHTTIEGFGDHWNMYYWLIVVVDDEDKYSYSVPQPPKSGTSTDIVSRVDHFKVKAIIISAA